MKKDIQKYYSRFSDMYTKDRHPNWFKFIENHNQKFNTLGYICNCKFCPGSNFNKRAEHELGHYAILQTPLYKDTKIVIVGNNNSWFDVTCMEEGLKVVKSLEVGIPKRNFYTEEKSKFSRSLVKAFRNNRSYELLKNNTVGLNRTWLQTGGSSLEIRKMKDRNNGDPSLVDICHKWTEEIISIINPQLILLLGKEAQKLFDSNFSDSHKYGNFKIQHCRHPSNGGQAKFENDLRTGLVKSKLIEQSIGA